MQRGRRRRGRHGRIPSPVYIEHTPTSKQFIPHPNLGKESITLEPAEIEVLRLINLEELTQEETGDRMGVSRGTIWRLLNSARKKVTKAIVEGHVLILHE
jgi:predicted DNA-binding protein (UPF0251 family)